MADFSCTSLFSFQFWCLIPESAAGHFLRLQTCDLRAAAGRLYLRGHGGCGTARSAWCRGHRVWFSRAQRWPGCSNPLIPPKPIPLTPPPPPLLTALGPDYKISPVWSGLILEKHNPRLSVTPTGIKHHNRPTYRSLCTQQFPDEQILKLSGIQNEQKKKKKKTANLISIVLKMLSSKRHVSVVFENNTPAARQEVSCIFFFIYLRQ